MGNIYRFFILLRVKLVEDHFSLCVSTKFGKFSKESFQYNTTKNNIIL